jgi:type IV pilus assembly protein PilA
MLYSEANQTPVLTRKNIMNANFKTKLLLKLANKKANKGFTLIELLVVTIIVGVLAAVALPNLLGQVGKARETAAKNGVGAINRAQQAFHFERQTFENKGLDNTALGKNNPLGVIVSSPYYNFKTSAGNAADVNVEAAPVNASKDGVRTYSGATNFDSTAGLYINKVCQSDQIGTAITTPAAGAASCPTSYVEIK